MDFSLRFLGSGNAWTKPPVNYHNNVLVEVAGKRLLLDCGYLCPQALFEQKIKLDEIDGIFISHLHGDHAGGLEEVGFFNYYLKNKRRIHLWLPRAFRSKEAQNKGEDIWDNALRSAMGTSHEEGTKKNCLQLEDYFNVHLMDVNTVYSFLGLDAFIFPVKHVPSRSCFGICLDNRVFYTSDCTFSQKRIEDFCNMGAQIIFHDVAFKKPAPNSVHTFFDELASLQRVIAEKIVLMHYSDAVTEREFQKASELGFRIAKKNSVFVF